jgi:nitrite reductase (NO-forming)
VKQPDIFSKHMARRRFLGVGAGVAAASAVGAVCGTGAGLNTYDEGTRAAGQAPASAGAAAPTPAASSDHSMPPSSVPGRPKASGKLATVYDAALPPLDPNPKKAIELESKDAVIEVAGGVMFNAWTFDGAVPGKVIHVRQGDSVDFTLKNGSQMGHSIDLHAAQTPWNINYKTILPGEAYSFNWKANFPGVFMYHCGTGPVPQHLLNGMYGAIVVDPAEALAPAREYVLVQSELYLKQAADGTKWDGDLNRMLAVQPDFVVFNGAANQYQQQPLAASVGERIRLHVVNAGPTLFSAFHVIGAIFDRAYLDGNPENVMRGVSTSTIPPGGGTTFELVIPEAGQYPFVTHNFAYTGLGAVGLIEVA